MKTKSLLEKLAGSLLTYMLDIKTSRKEMAPKSGLFNEIHFWTAQIQKGNATIPAVEARFFKDELEIDFVW